MKVQNLDFSPQFTRALDLMENGSGCLFITGHAGTGKSTLLEHFRGTTNKNVVILAPTGVAALNVKGQTIHSFFGFRPGTTPENIKRYYRNRGKQGLYKQIDAIIIDEISMVRADLLDCVDEFLRLHAKDPNQPFGGTRMIFIGDLHQLPPVVPNAEAELFNGFYGSPYFFSAKVMDRINLDLIELDKIYRQDDQEFIEILSGIRKNSLSEDQLELLNKSHSKDFELNPDDFYIYLTTTNNKADQINQNFLDQLIGRRHTFKGFYTGDFDKKNAPTASVLELKVGAQVMTITNDRAGRFVNGSIGKIHEIIELGQGKDIIVVELEDGDLVEILPYTWEVYKYQYNPATNQLQSESVGSYTQYPLILSWAITIHKSQGKTFDKVVVDFGWGTFAHGQAYVALSRCRSLEGMVLTKPFSVGHIKTDMRIVQFFDQYEFGKNPWELGTKEKIALIKDALKSGQLLKIQYDGDEFGNEHLVGPLELEKDKFKAHSYSTNSEVVWDLAKVVKLTVVEEIV